MTAPPPRLAWWRRKRTWVGLLLWLAVAFPISWGPISYGVARGWLPHTADMPFFPLFRVMNALPRPASEACWAALTGYGRDWYAAGERHAASD